MNVLDLLQKHIRPLLESDMMAFPPCQMLPDTAARYYATVDLLHKILDARKKDLNGRIAQIAKEHGVVDRKGHRKCEYGGVCITYQLRQGKEPDATKMQKLLEEREIDVNEVFDEVTLLQYNPSKATQLIERGVLKQEEVDALRDKTYAVLVDRPFDIATWFDVKPRETDPTQPVPEK